MIDPLHTGEPARPPVLPMPSWQWWTCTSQLWWVRSQGGRAVDSVRRERLRALIQHARLHSRYFARAWRDLPDGDLPLAMLPVTRKHELMAQFDDWVTDPAVTRAGVEAFQADPARIGQPFAGRHAVWRSSGSTGEPGIFVHDPEALAVYNAMLLHQIMSTTLAGDYSAGLFAHGGRAALIAATEGHFASIAAWRRQNLNSPWCSARAWSALQPVHELVEALNAWQPAFVASYPTVLALLAAEQREGRLHISPSLMWSGGEYLAGTCRTAIGHAFDCPLVNEYGSSECLSIAYECPHGWLHVNADWVILEPVGADGQPTPPGGNSHTCLLTNLANRVQPVIRYELGDSIQALDGRCPCGSPMPAIHVRGRMDDVVALHGAAQEVVRLPPLALTTVVEEAAGISRFQIVQMAPDRLALRLEHMTGGARQQAWDRASAALRTYLDRQGLANVSVQLADEAPAPDPISGKLREVVAGRHRAA